jgi:predicted TIM-barrel fold metal-dependent hydrolase
MKSSLKSVGQAFALFFGVAFAAAQSLAQAVEYRGETMPAVDIHLHPGSYDSLGPLGKKFVEETLPPFIPEALRSFTLRATASIIQNPYGPFFGIKSQCEENKLTHCGLFATYAPETWGVVPNREIREWLEDRRNVSSITKKPLFFGLASLDINEWETKGPAQLAELEKDLEYPLFKGIKLAFIHNNKPLDDEQYDGIYELAARTGKPVYHHVGSTPIRKLKDFPDDSAREEYIRSFDPKGLETVIKLYPSVTFILGHMGFDFNQEGFAFDEDVFQLALKYPNVYLELSAFGASSYDLDGKFKDKVLARIKQSGLIDRTIYASDGPGAPGGVKRYLTAMLLSFDRVGYTTTEAKKVLNDNAVRIFSLEH